MALKVWDGFDHYKDRNDFLSRGSPNFLQWTEPGNVQIDTIAFVTGRNGFGKAAQMSKNGSNNGLVFGNWRAVFTDHNAEAWVGFAHEINQGSMNWVFLDTITGLAQVSLYQNHLGYNFVAYRGNQPGIDSPAGTLLGVTSNNVWANGVYNFIEFGVKIDPTVGYIKVKVNGVLVLNLTGINTQNTANASWDSLVFMNLEGGGGIGATWLVDDLYYTDNVTGPGTHPCNTFLGDSKTVTLFATGNSSVQWTPFANTNYQEINETAMDSDTSYNSDITPGHEDLFTFQPLTGTIAVIYGVQLTGAYRKDDAGDRQIKQALKSGATEVYGPIYHVPDVSYAYFTDPFILNPNTSLNWTSTNVNALLAGYQFVA